MASKAGPAAHSPPKRPRPDLEPTCPQSVQDRTWSPLASKVSKTGPGAQLPPKRPHRTWGPLPSKASKTGPGTNPSSHPIGTTGPFLQREVTEAYSRTVTSINCSGEASLELYLHSLPVFMASHFIKHSDYCSPRGSLDIALPYTWHMVHTFVTSRKQQLAMSVTVNCATLKPLLRVCGIESYD
jgi:hypothetical protein